MKFLLDTQTSELTRRLEQHPSLVLGQLLTPLTRYAHDRKHIYAVDNGCFSRGDVEALRRLLGRQWETRSGCLFVAVPDVVGNARRTLEVFEQLADTLQPWPLAFVCQDGQEDLPIPWQSCKAVFIGGTTEWKDSQAAADIVRAAVLIGRHVHVGRVNTVERYTRFAELGAHTCDGSGVSRFDWMLDAIAGGETRSMPLLDEDNPCSARSEHNCTADAREMTQSTITP